MPREIFRYMNTKYANDTDNMQLPKEMYNILITIMSRNLMIFENKFYKQILDYKCPM